MSYQQSDGSTPIKFNPSKDSDYRSGNVSNRPVGKPKSNKDFEQVFGKSNRSKDDDEVDVQEVTEEEGELSSPMDIAASKKTKAPSPFDLSRGKVAEKKPVMQPRPLPQSPNASKMAASISLFDDNENIDITNEAAEANVVANANLPVKTAKPMEKEQLFTEVEEKENPPQPFADNTVRAKPLTKEGSTSKVTSRESSKEGAESAVGAVKGQSRGKTDKVDDIDEDGSSGGLFGQYDPSGKIKQTSKPATFAAESVSKKQLDSPSSLFSKMNAESKDAVEGQEKNFTTRFATEQPDISYVNPLAAANNPSGVAQVNMKTEKPIPTTHIQEIINQMVEKVQEITDTGRTDTVITLKHPPMFAGANIVVSAYDSAKGEFNIAFENLTQAAKEMLDMRTNQESLKQALIQKGYAVHIVTTTTLVENPTRADTTPSRDEQERQAYEERPRQRNQESEEG